MSISATRNWISSHKRKDNAVERWDAALADTKKCADVAYGTPGGGFARLDIYYN